MVLVLVPVGMEFVAAGAALAVPDRPSSEPPASSPADATPTTTRFMCGEAVIGLTSSLSSGSSSIRLRRLLHHLERHHRFVTNGVKDCQDIQTAISLPSECVP
ncbi:hypothetical protein [Streptomyces sp. NRRL S-98]|uniref:hypothetical protein n=1 Tax=Streptomyces sp. NRRL S-98 TaxID=1463922 RepID=UPI00131CB674|nr:hypothetical protein [Streptomyces sp. NRRL S-98]